MNSEPPAFPTRLASGLDTAMGSRFLLKKLRLESHARILTSNGNHDSTKQSIILCTNHNILNSSRKLPQCPFIPSGWAVEADSAVWDGNGGNGGDGTGVVGRRVVLVSFIGERTSWGDNIG